MAYARADRITTVLVYFMVGFSPWAFGTTEPWSVALMSSAGGGLGLLLLYKRWLRWRTGYCPPRWGEPVAPRGRATRFRPSTRAARWLTRSLAGLTGFILVYNLVSAVNARSRFDDEVQTFYDNCILWLPHSYNAPATWEAFWRNLGLAGFFWALRDWLLGRTEEEGGLGQPVPSWWGFGFSAELPCRMSRLLWILCLNGALLGIVSILQRLDGTDRLLWLVTPRFGAADFHFGPFPYRGNGAQYFNLLWPVCLAFWWTLFRDRQARDSGASRVGDHPHWALLPTVLVLAACPVISASHGGAVVALVEAAGVLAVFLVVHWRTSLPARLAMMAPFLGAVALAVWLGWSEFAGAIVSAPRDSVRERLRVGLVHAFEDDLGERLEIYRNAATIAHDQPWFGIGPGAFPAVYRLYRAKASQPEAAYAHNDWLQLRLAFGRVGFAAILLLLAHPFLRWWVRDGIPCRWDLVALPWIALGGCLLHAYFDFPMQIYCLRLLFLTLCCLCICVARRP
jgi:hypothetical protein